VGTVTWQPTQTGATHGAAVAAARSHAADLEQGRLVFCMFLLIQLLDGGLTYWGVSRFGIELEMNGLLATWMHEIGPAPTLFVAKTLACLCGFILYRAEYLRPLAIVAGLCLGVAVVPWAFLMAALS
jgi:hypothetical protein